MAQAAEAGYARTGIVTSELQSKGYCVVRARFGAALLDACRAAFWPILLAYLEAHHNASNRGPNRHYLPMPFELPCFAPEFFFDPEILSIVRETLGRRFVADQWGCDVPVAGSEFQAFHVDYQRPLFEESPELILPPYFLAVSFSLADITSADGPIEIVPGTHRMSRTEATRATDGGELEPELVLLKKGDVLIRHPWALHRGTPSRSHIPRALLTIRYVRRWYIDDSREVSAIPRAVWESLTSEQQGMLRFPIAD